MESHFNWRHKSRHVLTGIVGFTVLFISLSLLFTSCKGEDSNNLMLAGLAALGGSSSGPPSSPAGVSATGGNNAITITWSESAGADSYDIYWGTETGLSTASATRIERVTSPYTHQGLANGTDYYYIVTAVKNGKESDPSGEATAYPYRTPLKTYQTTSYAAGDDGDLQAGLDANFTGPVDAGGGDYTTTDNVTGLVWKTCSEGLSGADCTGTATTLEWDTAMGTGTGCDALNAGSGYAGHTDWRLPTLKEMESIVNYSTNNPTTFTTSFPSTQVDANYWTSSEDAYSSSCAWRVDFIFGLSKSDYNYICKMTDLHVRCVSPGTAQTIAPGPYLDNGDYTVTDKGTGLVWQKCSMGQNNDSTCSGSASAPAWSDAVSYCSNLTLAGRSWRLPNENELRTLVDETLVTYPESSIDTTVFPATAAYYWSSTTMSNDATYAYAMEFQVIAGAGVGYSTATGQKSNTSTFSVRCVSSDP